MASNSDPLAGLDPASRDLMIRTAVAEAGSDPAGQAAVMSVIRNRLESGKWGKSVADVVLAPNQFEVWTNGRAREVNPNSSAYVGAARLTDAVSEGLPDITGGATHFYAPRSQAALGRQPPAWAAGQPLANIGGQLFYAPNGRVAEPTPDQPASNQIELPGSPSNSGAPPVPSSSAAPDPTDDVFKAWGVNTGASSKASAAPSVSPSPQASGQPDPDAVFKAWGVDTGQGAGKAAAAAAKVPQPAPAAPATPVGVNDSVRAVATGVPVVGGLLNKADAATDAALAPVLNRFFAPQDQLQGETFGARYNNALQQQNGMDTSFAAAHPAANLLLNTAGAVGGTIPMVAAAPAAFGIGEGALGLRALAGAATSGAIGGADAAVRGQSPGEGALIGAGGGIALPVAGAALGKGANLLARGFSSGVPGVQRPAVNLLTRALANDNPQAVQGALGNLGPQAMLADAGPSFLGYTQGLATNPEDAAKSVIANALQQRAAGTTTRLGNDLIGALGPAPLPSQVEAGINDALESLGPKYQDVMRGASAVDTQPLANRLESSMANLRGPALSAVKQVRSFLNVPGTDALDPNPQALLATRQAIDGLLGNEQNPQVIRQLSMARQDVDGALANAVPGIKDVDAQYADLMRQKEALQSGSRVLDNGKTALRPQDFAQDFRETANPQGTMVGPSAVPLRTQQGARAEIDRLVGTKANDLAALKNALQGEGGWNTQKLEAAFGKKATNDLLNAVNRENAFSDTTNRVLNNSQTAARQGAQKALERSNPVNVNLRPANWLGLGLQAGRDYLLNPLVNALTGVDYAARDSQLANALTAQGPARDQILQQLLAAAQRQGQAGALGTAINQGTIAGGNALLNAGRPAYQAASGQ